MVTKPLHFGSNTQNTDITTSSTATWNLLIISTYDIIAQNGDIKIIYQYHFKFSKSVKCFLRYDVLNYVNFGQIAGQVSAWYNRTKEGMSWTRDSAKQHTISSIKA